MLRAERARHAGRDCVVRRFSPQDTERYKCWGSGSGNDRVAAALLPDLVPEPLGHWTQDGTEVTAQLWVAAPTLLDAGVDRRNCALAGATLGTIHRQRGSGPGSLDGAHRFDGQAEAFASRWGHAVRLVAHHGAALAEALDAWGTARMHLTGRAEARLVHGDFGASNLLVAGERCHVIDWEHARWGDPYEDLAKLKVARDFPEPNGIAKDARSWEVFTSAWAAQAEVTWSCDDRAMELYEVYFLMCLSVFFDHRPNLRLERLRHLVAPLRSPSAATS